MWNKREDDPTRPPMPGAQPPAMSPQPAPSPVVPVERRDAAGAGIGPSISIVGDVSGEEDLTILGKVEGKILLPKHSVTIGHGGRVKADIQAKFVSVAGEVHGNLIAGEQIVIRKTATMLGNLTAPRVGLEDGCRFRGSVEMEAPREAARQEPPRPEPARGGAPEKAAAGHAAPKPEATPVRS